MILTKDHMSRIFDMLDYDRDARTAAIFSLLSDCWPTGRPADMERATMKQLHYIRSLAGLHFDGPNSEGWDFLVTCPGYEMSKTQAGHIIGKLLARKEAPATT